MYLTLIFLLNSSGMYHPDSLQGFPPYSPSLHRTGADPKQMGGRVVKRERGVHSEGCDQPGNIYFILPEYVIKYIQV
jgi:hypothetical protein